MQTVPPPPRESVTAFRELMTLPPELELIEQIESGVLPGDSCIGCGAAKGTRCCFRVTLTNHTSPLPSIGLADSYKQSATSNGSSSAASTTLNLPALMCETCIDDLLKQPGRRFAVVQVVIILLISLGLAFSLDWIPALLVGLLSVIPIVAMRRLKSMRRNLLQILLSNVEVYAELLRHYPDCEIQLELRQPSI